MSDEATKQRLDLERTRLANERTLLAYVRTALTLAAAGATLVFVLNAPPAGRYTGVALIACAAACLGFGVLRFAQVARRIG